MRLLSALGFLLATGAGVWLSSHVMVRWSRDLKHAQSAMSFLIGAAVLLLQFVAFWLLTGLFPFFLVLLLIGGSLVAVLLHELLGAVGGFGLRDVKEKVGALGVIWGTQNKVAGCATIVGGLLILGGQTVGVLGVYFAHPSGSREAVGWIALLLFILPRLAEFPVQLVSTWPIVTSEFVDNDVRNTHLSRQFTAMVTSTVIFVYPFMLFREQMVAVVGRVPPLWLLFSIPAFFFAFGGLLPFFLGTYRFRSRADGLLRWRRDWLTAVLPMTRLPADLRRAAMHEKMESLRGEIVRRFAEHRVLTGYQELFPATGAPEEAPADTPPPQAAVSVDVGSTALQPGDADGASSEMVEVDAALAYLEGRQPPGEAPPSGYGALADNVMQILARYRHRLVEWDFSLHEIRELLNLYGTLLRAGARDVSAFVEESFKGVEKDVTLLRGSARGAAVGWMVTALSSAPIAVAKAYQDEIVAVLVRVIGPS